MAKRIAQFHKVSFDKFQEGFIDCFGPVEEREIRDIYEAIKLPVRATRGSAGYDFFAPLSLSIAPGDESPREHATNARHARYLLKNVDELVALVEVTAPARPQGTQHPILARPRV